MALGFNATNFANYLKKRYSPKFVETMAYRNKPLFATLPKMTDMTGKSWEQPVLFEDPASRSATFATAKTLSETKASNIARFSVTRVSDYGIIRLDNETLRASKGNEGAFREMVTTAIDGIMRSVVESACVSLYRKGWGRIGTVSSPGASTTLTLTNKQDVVNFKKGAVIQFAEFEGTGVLRDSGATLTVEGVDRNAGTLTVSANVTSISGIADGDSIFYQGDRENVASPTRQKIAGLGDWVPDTAPASTAFFGQDRTVDTRLGGVRVDGSNFLIEEALVELGQAISREGGEPDAVFMNPTQYGKLVNSLGGKVNYVDVMSTGSAGIGFRALEYFLPSGTVKIMQDRFCPVDQMFMLQMDTWMMGSLGVMPEILNLDKRGQDLEGEDGIQLKVGYYGNLIGKAPGWNGVAHSLPTT